MLEFRADPQSPYHDKKFDPRGRHRLLRVGRPSALSGKALKDLGYKQVYNLGAFKDWVEAGGAVESADRAGQ